MKKSRIEQVVGVALGRPIVDGNTITREKLYEEVWSTPVSRLAPKYNLSDVGFAKLCRRCNIPLPPRGYWAKLEAGQKIERTPLPIVEDEGEIRVHVPDPAEMAMKEKARMEVEKHEAQLPKIEVAETLRGCHQLVSTTNDAYQGAKKRDDGLLHSPDDSQLSLLVSREQLRRSLLVMSALLRAFESLGHKVSAGPKIKINGQSVTLAIREATVKVEEEFDASKESIAGRYDFFSERKRKKQVSSGLLTVAIPEADAYWASGCRKQWKDTKTQRIENCLNSIVAGVLAIAEKKQEHEIQQEQEAIRKAEEEKLQRRKAAERAKKREEQKQEKLKLDDLLAQASDLRRSREIREFDPNNNQRGGSTAIQRFLEQFHHYGSSSRFSFDYYSAPKSKTKLDSDRSREFMKMIYLLAEAGGKWRPAPDEIKSARNSLTKMIPEYTVEFISLMARFKAAKKEDMEELLRTPTIKSLVGKYRNRIDAHLESLTVHESTGPC